MPIATIVKSDEQTAHLPRDEFRPWRVPLPPGIGILLPLAKTSTDDESHSKSSRLLSAM